MRAIGSTAYLRGSHSRVYPDAYRIIGYGDGDNAGLYLLDIPGVNTDPAQGPVGYWAEGALRDDPDPKAGVNGHGASNEVRPENEPLPQTDAQRAQRIAALEQSARDILAMIERLRAGA